MKIKYIIIYMLSFLCISCFHKKNIKITGYTYKGDVIKIYNENNNLIYYIKVEKNEKVNGLCPIYESFQTNQKNIDFKLNILLDSSKIILVDTVILISRDNKKPYILFSDPADTNFKRVVGVHDNSNYIVD